MLQEKYSEETLKSMLLPREEYRPYPQARDRGFWEGLPDPVREAYLAQGEARLGFDWPALPASRYMDFVKNGNRSRYEEAYFDRRRALGALVLAECFEGSGRFLETIANGLWALCEESSWVVPAHMSLSLQSKGYALPDVDDPVIDLFAAETASLLAWTAYLLEEELDRECPMLRKRIGREMDKRIFVPFLEREDFWWMGFSARKVNNWNPWILSNVMGSFLLLENDQGRRAQALAKALRSLDTFLAVYLPDGGCDEGPGYWGHAGGSLFDCLEHLYLATEGRITFYEEPLVQEIGRYFARVHIAGDYYVNFADGDARLKVYGDLVYRYGLRIGDEALCALGADAFRRSSLDIPRIFSLFRILPALADYDELQTYAIPPLLLRDVWLDGIHLFAAREQAGSEKGLYVAGKGGHNDESHNHNDVGHFIVYADGLPALIDIGVETYTSKTFSPRRYEIWTMQSAYHALPTVRGIQQAPGDAFQAADVHYAAEEESAEFSLELASAYPAEAELASWKRTIRLDRPAGGKAAVHVTDSFSLSGEPADVTLSLMTLQEPQLAEGRFTLAVAPGMAVRVAFDADRLAAESERIEVGDAKLRAVWGDRVHRVVLRAKEPVRQEQWRLVITQEHE